MVEHIHSAKTSPWPSNLSTCTLTLAASTRSLTLTPHARACLRATGRGTGMTALMSSLKAYIRAGSYVLLRSLGKISAYSVRHGQTVTSQCTPVDVRMAAACPPYAALMPYIRPHSLRLSYGFAKPLMAGGHAAQPFDSSPSSSSPKPLRPPEHQPRCARVRRRV